MTIRHWIALAALCLAGAADAAPPLYREIGDWILGCDNGRHCVAKYVPEDDGAEVDVNVAFDRDGGRAEMAVSLSAEQPVPAPALRIDGRPVAAPIAWRVTPDATSAYGPAVTLLARRATAGRTLSIGAQPVSLKGLAAVMLAMDEAQGRLGNRSAVVRAGPAPATATPAAPPLPVILPGRTPPLRNAAALIAAVRRSQAAVMRAHECDMDAGLDDDAAGLTDREAIVLIGCGRFAYQSSVLAFRVDRRAPHRPRLLVLPRLPTLARTAGTDEDGEYVGGSFDAAGMSFTEYGKGRGLADCGLSASWTFDGTAFRLTDMARQERCGGLAGDWLVLYRSSAKRR